MPVLSMNRATTLAAATGAFVATLALAVTPPPAAAQTNFDKVQMKVTEVAPGIHMLEGAGGNIGVCSGDEGVFVIDDEFAPLTDKIVAAIKTFSDKPVRLIVNTHCHADHVGGNENFGKMGTLIVAQDNVRKRMSAEQVSELFQRTTPPYPEVALPVVTFDNTVTFHVNGQTLYVFHVPPAHTDGDAVIQFKERNVVHTGDIFFNGMYPIIDVSVGGSIDGMVGAADKILAICDDNTKLIPGHGPLGTKAQLAAYRDMVAGVRDAVKAEVDAGKSLDETIAAHPTAKWDDPWGKGYIKPDLMVKMAYTSLTNGKG